MNALELYHADFESLDAQMEAKDWEKIKEKHKDLEESLVARIDHLIKTNTVIGEYVTSDDPIINGIAGDDLGALVYKTLTKTE